LHGRCDDPREAAGARSASSTQLTSVLDRRDPIKGCKRGGLGRSLQPAHHGPLSPGQVRATGHRRRSPPPPRHRPSPSPTRTSPRRPGTRHATRRAFPAPKRGAARPIPRSRQHQAKEARSSSSSTATTDDVRLRSSPARITTPVGIVLLPSTSRRTTAPARSSLIPDSPILGAPCSLAWCRSTRASPTTRARQPPPGAPLDLPASRKPDGAGVHGESLDAAPGRHALLYVLADSQCFPDRDGDCGVDRAECARTPSASGRGAGVSSFPSVEGGGGRRRGDVLLADCDPMSSMFLHREQL
jgi:hypothetical protein